MHEEEDDDDYGRCQQPQVAVRDETGEQRAWGTSQATAHDARDTPNAGEEAGSKLESKGKLSLSK